MSIATDITRLRSLARSMSAAFRDSNGGGIMERFENVSKLMFLDLYRYYHPAVFNSTDDTNKGKRTSRSIYEHERAAWRNIQAMEPEVLGTDSNFPNDVEAVAKCRQLLDTSELSEYPASARGVVYEELLSNTFEKNENQQFFTPTQIVDFIISLVNVPKNGTILDPACGSGGFLCAAQSVLDERSDTRLVGLDIDERMCWIARTNLLVHGSDSATICCLPGAGSLGEFGQVSNEVGGLADLILENPPFGSDVYDQGILSLFETGRNKASRRRSVLFLERSVELLSDGGVMAAVVDDSVLNLDGNADIRSLIRNTCAIVAVISLPGVTFMPYSSAKSSILIVKKGAKQGPVFMARVSEVGRRTNGEPLFDDFGELVTDLPEVIRCWNKFKAGNLTTNSDLGYIAELETDLGGRLDANYYHPSRFAAEESLSKTTYPVYQLKDLFDFVTSSASLSSFDSNEPITWVGLADIDKKTGQYRSKCVLAKTIKSQVHCFKPGDVLFSRLRPELRKTIFCKDDGEGYCSSELLVMRLKCEHRNAINPEYVAIALRSEVTYGQIVYKVTGLGRPRIGINNVRSIRIPIPSIEEQTDSIARYHEALDDYAAACRRLEHGRKKAFDTLEDIQDSLASTH